MYFSFLVHTFIHCVFECTGRRVDSCLALVVDGVNINAGPLLCHSPQRSSGGWCLYSIKCSILPISVTTLHVVFATTWLHSILRLGVDRIRFTTWTPSRSPQQWPFAKSNVFFNKSQSSARTHCQSTAHTERNQHRQQIQRRLADCEAAQAHSETLQRYCNLSNAFTTNLLRCVSNFKQWRLSKRSRRKQRPHSNRRWQRMIKVLTSLPHTQHMFHT